MTVTTRTPIPRAFLEAWGDLPEDERVQRWTDVLMHRAQLVGTLTVALLQLEAFRARGHDRCREIAQHLLFLRWGVNQGRWWG